MKDELTRAYRIREAISTSTDATFQAPVSTGVTPSVELDIIAGGAQFWAEFIVDSMGNHLGQAFDCQVQNYFFLKLFVSLKTQNI